MAQGSSELAKGIAVDVGEVVKGIVGGTNRTKNPPHPDAQGAHTTFKRNQQTGKVTKYDTYIGSSHVGPELTPA